MGREWCGAGGGLRPQRDRLMPSHGVKVAGQEENQRLKIKMQNYKVKIKKVNWDCFFGRRQCDAFDKSLLNLRLPAFGTTEIGFVCTSGVNSWVVTRGL